MKPVWFVSQVPTLKESGAATSRRDLNSITNTSPLEDELAITADEELEVTPTEDDDFTDAEDVN